MYGITVIADLSRDSNPLEGGAWLIMQDGRHEVHTLSEMVDGAFHLHRFTIDKLWLSPAGELCGNEYHPALPEWFGEAARLASMCRSMGLEVAEAVELATSDNPQERAAFYLELIGYYGPVEFDSYPLALTRREAVQRIQQIYNRQANGRFGRV